jgi:diguanylate cyclase (GGDEF)-like protein
VRFTATAVLLAGYAAAAASGLLFLRAKHPQGDPLVRFDVALTVVAAAILYLDKVDGVDGHVTLARLAGARTFVLSAAMVATLATSARMLAAQRGRVGRSSLLLLGAAIAFLVGSIEVAATTGGIVSSVRGSVWPLGASLLVGLAAWHPSMVEVVTATPARPTPAVPIGRVVAVALTLLSLPVTLFGHALAGEPVPAAPLGALSLVMLSLVAAEVVVAGRRLRGLQDELAVQAVHDSLTGLGNRALLGGALAELREQARATGDALCVVFLDLNGFKAVNDELGHAAGDSLLAQVAGRLSGAVRLDDVLARFGGDEFVAAAVVPAASADAAADELAARLRASLGDPFDLGGRTVSIGAATGASVAAADDPRTLDDLLRDADACMYRAKRARA